MVACIALLVHLFQITKIPAGIHVDEMGMGYDAWCLAHFGVDRYLKAYPVYLMNFGGGQSALYAYLCIPFVKWLGLSPLSIRLPGILLYMVALFCGAGVFMLDAGDTARKKALAGMALMTVLPAFILLFRIGMDCNLMLAMAVIFLYLMARAVKVQRVTAFAAAGIAGGVLLYTYVISYVVLPVFIALLLVYLLWIRQIRFCQVLAFGIPLAFLAAPLIAVQVVNLFDLPEFRMGPFTITRLFQYRGGEIGLGHLSARSVKDAVMSVFMFDGLRYNTLIPFGTVYYVSLPLIGIGIAVCAGFCMEYPEESVLLSDPVFALACGDDCSGMLHGGEYKPTECSDGGGACAAGGGHLADIGMVSGCKEKAYRGSGDSCCVSCLFWRILYLLFWRELYRFLCKNGVF